MAHTIIDHDTAEQSDDASPADLRLAIDALSARESLLETKVGRRDSATLAAYVAAVVALLVAVVAVGFGARALDEADDSATGGAAAVGAPSRVSVHLSEFTLDPATVTVAAGGTVEVTNHGTMPHDFAIVGTDLATRMLSPGESDTIELGDLAAGDYETLCQVPGHGPAGMKGTLHVGGGSTGASTPGGVPAPASAGATSSAVIDASATPGPEWKAFDPTLQPAAGGAVHDVAISASETVLEVAPGVTQEMWTFNGQVPGPVLHGKVGDVFNVTLTNDGKVGHSIDFHASEVAPNVEMRTLAPGESLVYQFKAEYAGAWMYHCGTAPALHHIGNGMFGAVVIDPPDLPAVDHELVMVQSEMYLGPQGQPGDLDKMVAERHDAVVFNGYYNQYKFAPIRVEPGERVRVWVVDAGPSENSSFHIVGTIFDTVYKEGSYLLRPGAGRGGAQALDLQPAQGGFVEFTLDRPGSYTMVTHKFANVGKGALGIFQAGEAAAPMSH